MPVHVSRQSLLTLGSVLSTDPSPGNLRAHRAFLALFTIFPLACFTCNAYIGSEEDAGRTYSNAAVCPSVHACSPPFPRKRRPQVPYPIRRQRVRATARVQLSACQLSETEGCQWHTLRSRLPSCCGTIQRLKPTILLLFSVSSTTKVRSVGSVRVEAEGLANEISRSISSTLFVEFSEDTYYRVPCARRH